MADTWMYDGFPLKRADADTRGDDYRYVIQSLDAAIRHLFTIPVGVSMTPAFSISENGSVEVLQNFAIGSAVQINEIVDSIAVTGTAEDDNRLANVSAIRVFTLEFIDEYLSIQDVFVLKAGDTMTGQLLAEGGISAAADLSLENVLFANSPRLPDRVALVSGGRSLIQWDDAVVVGSTNGELRLTGAGTRPSYRGEAVALVQDIEDAVAAPGIDYVPEAGGSFSGLVSFDAGLLLPTAIGLQMEYNAGGSLFTFAYVFDDVLGEVEVGAPGGVRFANELKLDQTAQMEFGAVWRDIIEGGAQLNLGNALVDLNLRGLGVNPTYNGAPLALLSDTVGAYVQGDGLTFTDLGGGLTFEIGITLNGITRNFMPVGLEGQYSRLNPATGVLEWDGLDIAAGTGMEVTENPVTFQTTVGIADLGVDTLQIADDAVNQDKVADGAVGYFQIDADQGAVVPTTDFTLVQRDDQLEWRKGGSILGTVQDLSDRDLITYGGVLPVPYYTMVSGSNGPYVIHALAITKTELAGDTSGYEIIIDGNSVKSGTTGLGTGVSEGRSDVLFGPLFAKESFEIKGRPPDNQNNYAIWEWFVTRLN